MLYLLFSIICSSAIIIIFKLFGKYKISTLPAIVYNYLIASVLGILTFQQKIEIVSITGSGWFPFALIIGVLFIIMFFMLALSTQKAGVTATTVSSRVSVVIPIVFSIFYFKEHIYTEKIVGILLAIVAVVLSVYKKRNENFHWKWVLLPVVIFFGMGLTDSFVKFSQENYLKEKDVEIFSAVLFSVSFISGLIAIAIKNSELKEMLKPKTIFFGLTLGAFNYGSLYFFVNALNFYGKESSKIFGINHLGIITLSVVIARLFFKEKQSVLNWIGVGLSIVAILILFFFNSHT